VWRRSVDSIVVDIASSQMTKVTLRERKAYRFQVQLEEDEASQRQGWIETSGLWPMLHWDRPGISN